MLFGSRPNSFALFRFKITVKSFTKNTHLLVSKQNKYILGGGLLKDEYLALSYAIWHLSLHHPLQKQYFLIITGQRLWCLKAFSLLVCSTPQPFSSILHRSLHGWCFSSALAVKVLSHSSHFASCGSKTHTKWTR